MNRREAQLERKRKERKGKVWREKRLEKKRCRGGERRGGVNLLKESKEKKKDEEEKNEERRRRRRGGGRKERLGTKKELGNGGETLSVGSWLAPPLVICSSDIIAACYSEAYQRTYRADYLSTDSTSLLPLSLSLLPSILAPSPFPSRLLPKNSSSLYFLLCNFRNDRRWNSVQQRRNTPSSFESSVSAVIDAWRGTFLGWRTLLNHRLGSFERGKIFVSSDRNDSIMSAAIMRNEGLSKGSFKISFSISRTKIEKFLSREMP